MTQIDALPGTSAPPLEARGVGKSYGEVRALDGVSLSLSEGECVALVGESGSGKTTLLRTFNRMVEPDEGEILRSGRNLKDLDPFALRRQTGYVQQEGGLLPHWTILDNAALVPRLLGMEDRRARAREALSRMGLPSERFGSRWPRELSGGQRQRVAIARALAAGPGVMLLDEPFGALDAITRFEMQEEFVALRDRLGITILLVTHDMREAARLADRVAVLRHGRIEQIASPASLAASPSTEYVARLLDRAGVGHS